MSFNCASAVCSKGGRCVRQDLSPLCVYLSGRKRGVKLLAGCWTICCAFTLCRAAGCPQQFSAVRIIGNEGVTTCMAELPLESSSLCVLEEKRS